MEDGDEDSKVQVSWGGVAQEILELRQGITEIKIASRSPKTFPFQISIYFFNRLAIDSSPL